MNSVITRPRSFTREIEGLFNDLLDFPTFRSEVDSDFVPRVNIKEDKDNVCLSFELPGMKKDDIKVSIKDNMLTVSGQRESKSEEKDAKYIRTEIRSGSFCRSFTLPDTINTERISADYKDGILEVALAKLEEVKPRQIEVKVK